MSVCVSVPSRLLTIKIITAKPASLRLLYFTKHALFLHDPGKKILYDKDGKTVLNVNNNANKGGENYGNLLLKSLITARLGDKTNAIIIAKQSMEKANTAKNMDYVRMSQKNISEWSK